MAKYQFNSQEVCIFPKESGIYIIPVIRYFITQGKIIPNLNLQANQIGDGKPIVRNL